MPAQASACTRGRSPGRRPPESWRVLAVAIIFWLCAALIIWTQLGYALALALIARLRAIPDGATPRRHERSPSVSLIVAAHDEQDVIADKVADALAQRYPRERLEGGVACDGCSDGTAHRAREAGAEVGGEVVPFSDANARWEPGALAALVAAFDDPDVGYACGQVRFVQAAGGSGADNQEGVYWRYKMGVRALESHLSSVTAG